MRRSSLGTEVSGQGQGKSKIQASLHTVTESVRPRRNSVLGYNTISSQNPEPSSQVCYLPYYLSPSSVPPIRAKPGFETLPSRESYSAQPGPSSGLPTYRCPSCIQHSSAAGITLVRLVGSSPRAASQQEVNPTRGDPFILTTSNIQHPRITMRDFSVPEGVATPATPPTLAPKPDLGMHVSVATYRATVSFCPLLSEDRTRSHIAMRTVRQTTFYFIRAQKTCYPRNEKRKVTRVVLPCCTSLITSMNKHDTRLAYVGLACGFTSMHLSAYLVPYPYSAFA